MAISIHKRKPAMAVTVTLLIITMVASAFVNATAAETSIEITVNPSQTIAINNFSVGFQLDGPDIRIWRDRAALRQLAQEAGFKLVRFFEHRIGKPCTRWYESSKTGQWDWSNIDLLINRIFEIGAEPLIVLGFVGYDSRRLTSVPTGMSYNSTTNLPYPDQWAAYCAEWVRHFQQVGLPVRYYEMINEAYHYFDWPATQPKLGYFMSIYNAAARAMRTVNSGVKIGNDACVLKTVLDYFISNGENLDFLSYHAYGTSTLSATDAQIFEAAETKYIVETSSVYGVDKTKQLYKAARGIDLPVFHSENNLNYYFTQGTDPRIQKMQGAVYNALTFRVSMLKNFYHTSYFHFASSASQQTGSSGGLGFGMVNSDNNQPWYPYIVNKMIGSNLDKEDTIVEASSNSSDIRAVAWINDGKLKVMLICKADQQRTVYLRGLTGQLSYEKIDNTISWENPSLQTGTVDASSALTINGYTVMLLQGDVSTTPPPAPPAPPTPPASTALFEDGFEQGDFSLWDQTRRSYDESVTVSSVRPYQGVFHGRFRSNGNGATEYAYVSKSVDSQELFVRGHFYIARGLPLTDNDDRFYFMQLRAGDQTLARIGVRRVNGVDRWVLYARDGTNWAGPYYNLSSVATRNEWYSIEIHWKRHVSEGLVEVYLGGEKILEISEINTDYFGNADMVDFGILSVTRVQYGLTVYGDCFKISEGYIGPDV
jgi:hypothetical protein